VAVTAVDAECRGVVVVAERNGLVQHHPLPGRIGRAAEGGDEPAEGGKEEDRTKDGDLGKGVRAAVEDLGHGRGLMAENTGASLTVQAADPSL
jgi:hypothetical protein